MPIIVNEVEITDVEVHAEMQHHPAESLDEARHKAARALVIRCLLVNEAVAKGILPGTEDLSITDEEQAIENLLDSQVSVPDADEKSCSIYYEQHLDRFLDKTSGKTLPFLSVESYIGDYLQACSLQAGISQYIKLLAGKAKIAGFDIEGYNTPLVQ